MVIYKITNLINNKIYIGKTINLKNRISKYKREANVYKNKNKLHPQLIVNAITKYGFENFKFDIIDITNDENKLNILEKEYISKFNSTNKIIGYNISNGGDGGDTLSHHPNINEISKKISKAISGENNGIHTLKKDKEKYTNWLLKNKQANSGANNANAKKGI